MELGKKLKSYRQAKGMSLYKLCSLTGLSANHIREVEKDAKTPTVETITRYLKPLDISLSEFFNEDESIIMASPNEKELIDLYRYLPPDKSELLLEVFRKFGK